MPKSHAMFAAAPRGPEELLADELAGLGLSEVRVPVAMSKTFSPRKPRYQTQRR